MIKKIALSLVTVALGLPILAAGAQAAATSTIINVGNGLCLADAGYSKLSSTQYVQWSCDGGSDDVFQLKENANGTYTFINTGSNMCVDVLGWATNAGAKITQYACDNNGDQEFVLTSAGSGIYTIKSKSSGLCLSFGSSKSDGTGLVQEPCGGDGETFKIAGGPSAPTTPTPPPPPPPVAPTFQVNNINDLRGAYNGSDGVNCASQQNSVAAPGWEWNWDPGSGPGCINSELVSSPSLDGQSRSMAINWACPGGAATCSEKWGGTIAHASINSAANKNLDPNDTSFSYSVWVYYTDLSQINALEFDLNQVVSNGDGTTDTIIYAAQCDFGDGTWDLGNHWTIHSNVPCLKNSSNPLTVLNKWHHIVLSYHRGAHTKGNDIVTYDSVSIDGTTYPFTGTHTHNDAYTLNWSTVGELIINWQMDFHYTQAGQTTSYADEISVTSPEQ